jgi:hypothetical protein
VPRKKKEGGEENMASPELSAIAEITYTAIKMEYISFYLW